MNDTTIYVKCEECGVLDSFSHHAIVVRGDGWEQKCNEKNCDGEWHTVIRCVIHHRDDDSAYYPHMSQCIYCEQWYTEDDISHHFDNCNKRNTDRTEEL